MEFKQIWIFSIICIATLVVGGVFRFVFRRFINKSVVEASHDAANYKFLGYFIAAMIYIIGFSWAVYLVEELRAIAQSLLAGAGILAVAVGFASQHALSNIISGLFIVLFKPYRIGDRIILQDKIGTVEDITLRHTVIRDFENRRIVIPNSIISNETLVNVDLTDSRIQRIINIGISYDSDISLAREIIIDEIKNHPLHIDGRTTLQVEEGVDLVATRVTELGDFAVNIRAWAWTNNLDDAVKLHGQILESVKKRFEENNIEIPFPYRTVVFKSDLNSTP